MPILEELLQQTPIRPEHDPDEIFHYTTAEGLHAILTTRKLWATDIQYLNDRSEFVYCSDLIREVGGSLTNRLCGLFNPAEILDQNVLETFHHYVSCFCEDEDLLSQWRAYGHYGAGYAIGFNVARLRHLYRSDAGAMLGRVVYDSNEQLRLIRQALEEALQPILGSTLDDKLSERMDEIKLQANGLSTEEAVKLFEGAKARISQELSGLVVPLLNNAYARLLAIRAFMKYPRFSEEREWRLVTLRAADSVDAQIFGNTGGVLVPRISLDLGGADSSPFSRIVVGPTLHPEMAMRSLRRFLRSLGIQRVEVQASPIPLRS